MECVTKRPNSKTSWKFFLHQAKQLASLDRLNIGQGGKFSQGMRNANAVDVVRTLTASREVVMLKVNARNLGAVAVLSLQGQIVTGEMECLRNVIECLPTVGTVILDLESVTLVDAGGLGMLLALREQALAKGIRFELMNVTKWVSRVFELTHLDSVFQITNGVELFPTVIRQRRSSVPLLASCA